MMKTIEIKTIDRIVNYIFLIIITVYGILLMIDIVSIVNNPEDYRIAQGFVEKQLTWKSKSVLRYIVENLAILTTLILLFIVGVKKLKNKTNNRLLKGTYYVFITIFCIVMVAGYCYWWRTGFDH